MMDKHTVLPLYIKQTDLTKTDENIAAIDLINAACKIVGSGNVIGAQRVNSLWLIYLKDRQSRLQLYTKGKLAVKGHLIQLYNENPFTSRMQHQQNDKLTIKNLPLSVSNDEIKGMLQEQNIQPVSMIRYGHIRDHEGQFTQYRSGDRYVYIKPMDTPIPRKQRVGDYPCLIIHHGKEMTCSACGVAGHRLADEACAAKPTEKIMAFRGYQHPLSNHYAYPIEVHDEHFKSVEHAFFHQMALSMKNPTLAKKIKEAKHAGIAKRLSKSIASDEKRWDWERQNSTVMLEILHAKLEQCPEFSRCLYENRHAIIAEATPSKIWGTGLSPHATENTAPSFWKGQNLLGSMLTELAQQVKEVPQTPAPEGDQPTDNADDEPRPNADDEPFPNDDAASDYESVETEEETDKEDQPTQGDENGEQNAPRRLRSGTSKTRNPNIPTSNIRIRDNASKAKKKKKPSTKKTPTPKQKKHQNNDNNGNRDIRQMLSPTIDRNSTAQNKAKTDVSGT